MKLIEELMSANRKLSEQEDFGKESDFHKHWLETDGIYGLARFLKDKGFNPTFRRTVIICNGDPYEALVEEYGAPTGVRHYDFPGDFYGTKGVGWEIAFSLYKGNAVDKNDSNLNHYSIDTRKRLDKFLHIPEYELVDNRDQEFMNMLYDHADQRLRKSIRIMGNTLGVSNYTPSRLAPIFSEEFGEPLSDNPGEMVWKMPDGRELSAIYDTSMSATFLDYPDADWTQVLDPSWIEWAGVRK